MSIELDPRFTFDSYVVGAGNRLAIAAARRVAESPGTTYNPLFIYSASGLGKTHLVTAVGHHARRVHQDLMVEFDTLEHFMEEVMTAIETGQRDRLRNHHREVGLLILDDVQFLAGKHRTQEELLRTWDALSGRGGQVILTSDRSPQEIDGIDERLLSRFSGGLIVDVGAPDYETRVAIVRRKAQERGYDLRPEIAETLARIAFGNVRELQGALNRLMAVQELEGRAISPAEVPELLGTGGGPVGTGDGVTEFGDFLMEIAGTVTEVVGQNAAERQLADAILRWEGDGFRTRRLEVVLAEPDGAGDIETLIRTFEADIERLREIAAEIGTLEPKAPELARADVLRDPDRIHEALVLLGEVRDRNLPLPAPPSAFRFGDLRAPPDSLVVRAARAVAAHPGDKYNPLFVHGEPGSGRSVLLAALGNEIQAAHPDAVVAFVEGPAFAEELIAAIGRNRADSFRARWRRAGILILDDVDALAGTERAQEELFHLFDVLQRAGAQLIFSAAQPPRAIHGLEDRLRTRLESGLVVELRGHAARTPVAAGVTGAAGAAATAVGAAADAGAAAAATGRDPWFESREKVVWDWPYLEDWLSEELD
jgi:chromosomal replication initiator protein